MRPLPNSLTKKAPYKETAGGMARSARQTLWGFRLAAVARLLNACLGSGR